MKKRKKGVTVRTNDRTKVKGKQEKNAEVEDKGREADKIGRKRAKLRDRKR